MRWHDIMIFSLKWYDDADKSICRRRVQNVKLGRNTAQTAAAVWSTTIRNSEMRMQKQPAQCLRWRRTAPKPYTIVHAAASSRRLSDQWLGEQFAMTCCRNVLWSLCICHVAPSYRFTAQRLVDKKNWKQEQNKKLTIGLSSTAIES